MKKKKSILPAAAKQSIIQQKKNQVVKGKYELCTFTFSYAPYKASFYII